MGACAARYAALTAALAAACSSPSTPPTPMQDAGPPAWHVVLQGLRPTLLSVWGTGPNDVFAVGGPRGNGTPSTVLHYDGHEWKDLAAGGTQTLWWAHGTSDADVWVVGENGRISHWDGAAFTEHTSGTTATLYGVWAAAPDDVWAVGGTPAGGTSQPNDVVLHFDGASWTPSPPPQTFGRAFFKVWGTSADNLYIVGEAATIWHRSGVTWSLEPNPAKSNLTTVAGCGPSEVYAVGGRDVLRSDGAAWTRVDVALTNDVSGVACASPGKVVIVGSGGLKQRLVGGQWQDDVGAAPYNTELHGAWADPAGAYWAAGGDYITSPQQGAARDGVVGYYGSTIPSGLITYRCPVGFLGDGGGAPDFDIQVLLADDTVALIQDGGAVPMLLPPQGGRVIFVGVRATNVDGCALQLTGALRDLTTQKVMFDSRTINLTSTGDGWGASASSAASLSAAIASFSNIPVCPNQWSAIDLYGHAYGLEVTIRDREKRELTKTIQVTPECAQPENLGECLCICQAGYVLGQGCGDGGSD